MNKQEDRKNKLERIFLHLEWEDRPREEKHMTWEQWIKVIELRNSLKNKRKNKNCCESVQRSRYSDKLSVGDTCSVWYNKERIGGIVRKVYKNGTYDVSSNTKFFKKVYARKRIKEKLDLVEIPKELKKLSTKRLLNLFKKTQRKVWFYTDDWNGSEFRYNTVKIGFKEFTYHQIKAELYNREHIKRK